ncbi:MAG: hypothetical protein WBG92_00475 [Thiohalocapsa sp.]
MLMAVATGVWAVWTWAAGHERDRDRERAKMSALYLKPLLSACEDLQSRIYSILELDGLKMLRKRYPDGFYAEETLYLMVRYFGWVWVASRHGPSPYIEDPVVMRLTSAVNGAFATASSAQQVGPFNFFHPEQKAMGKLVLTRFHGPYGVEFDTISSYEFKTRLIEPPLCDSAAVKETLEALRSTDDAANLPGRLRLIEVQNQLVELLAYIEKKEGYTLLNDERKKCGAQTQLGTAASSKPSPVLST